MTLDKEVRVGFVLPSGQWLGGRNYLRNLFAALRILPNCSITPIVFTGRSTSDADAEFPEIEIVRTSVLDRKSPGWFVRQVIAKSISRDVVLQKVLQRHRISVLSHCFHLGRNASIKTIGWIPDFQHVHLPEFFSAKELQHRNREYIKLCVHSAKVIVSSECARADLLAFAPEHASKAELLQFVANPAPLHRATSLTTLQQLYGFEGPYFLLPNQFWAHKNHRVVIKALEILKRRNQPLLVLTTGSTEDHRNPSFFSSLMRYVGECEVLDCFRVLGQIPFDHLVGLMQHSVAFINPSRFEGWSTSVEEAKSMGKQVVLSDLPVHREQAPERALFFPPNEPEALAAAMIEAKQAYDPELDRSIQAMAIARFNERQLAYGGTYVDIVNRALFADVP